MLWRICHLYIQYIPFKIIILDMLCSTYVSMSIKQTNTADINNQVMFLPTIAGGTGTPTAPTPVVTRESPTRTPVDSGEHPTSTPVDSEESPTATRAVGGETPTPTPVDRRESPTPTPVYR